MKLPPGSHPIVALRQPTSPDAERGQIVKAYVVLRPGRYGGEAMAAELQQFVKQTIAPYKYPRSVEFIAELPRNPSGKVLKKDLREPYWRGHTRRVG